MRLLPGSALKDLLTALRRLRDRFRTGIPQYSFAVYTAVPVALWLAFGVLLVLLPVQSGSRPVVAVGGVILAAAALWTVSAGAARRLLLFLPLGSLLAAAHLAIPWDTYTDVLPRPDCGACIRAVVIDPAGGASQEASWLKEPRRYLIRLTAIRLSPAQEWQEAGGRAFLEVPRGMVLPYGARLEAAGGFCRPDSPVPTRPFDYRRYLRGQHIQHVFTPADIRVVSGARGWRCGLAVLYRWRARAADALAQDLDRETSAPVAAAMTLGYRRGLDYDLRQEFLRSSALHVFAISGLHVGIAASVLLMAFRVARIPFRFRYVALPLILGGYVFITGGAASAVRAWIMISVWSTAKAMLRPIPPLNAVALAAAVLLLWNPLQILQPGFQF